METKKEIDILEDKAQEERQKRIEKEEEEKTNHYDFSEIYG